MTNSNKNKILVALALVSSCCPAYSHANTVDDKQKSQQTASSTQPIVVYAISPKKSDQEAADDKAKADDDNAIKHRELVLTVFIAIAAVVQAFAAIWQGFIYRGQRREMTIQRIITHNTLNTYKAQSSMQRKILRPRLSIGDFISDTFEEARRGDWVFVKKSKYTIAEAYLLMVLSPTPGSSSFPAIHPIDFRPMPNMHLRHLWTSPLENPLDSPFRFIENSRIRSDSKWPRLRERSFSA